MYITFYAHFYTTLCFEYYAYDITSYQGWEWRSLTVLLCVVYRRQPYISTFLAFTVNSCCIAYPFRDISCCQQKYNFLAIMYIYARSMYCFMYYQPLRLSGYEINTIFRISAFLITIMLLQSQLVKLVSQIDFIASYVIYLAIFSSITYRVSAKLFYIAVYFFKMQNLTPVNLLAYFNILCIF